MSYICKLKFNVTCNSIRNSPISITPSITLLLGQHIYPGLVQMACRKTFLMTINILIYILIYSPIMTHKNYNFHLYTHLCDCLTSNIFFLHFLKCESWLIWWKDISQSKHTAMSSFSSLFKNKKKLSKSTWMDCVYFASVVLSLVSAHGEPPGSVQWSILWEKIDVCLKQCFWLIVI